MHEIHTEYSHHEPQPWVRADLQRANDFTRSLVPEHMREHYDFILQELGEASLALVEAQERYRNAIVERLKFFNGMTEL